jgi:hypothetical protein
MKLFLPLAVLLFGVPAIAQSSDPPNECVRVTAESVTLRGKAALTGKAIDVVAKNTQLQTLATRDGWILVQTEDYAGWIEIRSISPCSGAPPVRIAAKSDSSTPNIGTVKPQANGQSTTSGARTYVLGPKGGCYYINSSGKKTYVDHSFCK